MALIPVDQGGRFIKPSGLISGTFNAGFSATTGTITINPANVKVYYTYDPFSGRVWFNTDALLVQSVAAPTGDMFVTGFPAIIVPTKFAAVAVYASMNNSGAVTSIMGRLDSGSNKMLLRRFNAGSAQGDLATLTGSANTTTFILSGTYSIAP